MKFLFSRLVATLFVPVVAALLVARAGIVLAKSGEAPVTEAPAEPRLQSTFWKLFTVFFLAASAGLMVLSQAASMVAAFGASEGPGLLVESGTSM